MDLQKIRIEENAVLADILRLFTTSKAKHVVLIFPTSFSLLSEAKFLKSLKEEAQKAEKTFSIISGKKFFRDILKKSDIETFARVPQKWTEGEEIPLQELLNPSEIKETENQEKNEEEPEEEKLPSFPSFVTSKVTKDKIPSRAKIFFGILLLAIFIVILLLWRQPRATITIKPKVDILPILQNFLVTLPEAEIDQADEQLPMVPSIFVETTIKDIEIVPTFGREYEVTNAKGKITLYNETEKPKFLVPSRLQDPNGIIVRFKKNVTIPPKTNNKAGEIVVEVEADSFDEKENPIGIRGNLDAGTELIFPALRDELQELYYAKVNKGPLVGGSTLTKYIVKEEDRELAEQKVLEDFRDRGIQELTDEIARRSSRENKNYILLENQDLLFTELVNFTFPEELIGQEHQTIEVPAEVKVSGIVFDQDSINKVIHSQSKKLLADREKIVKIDDTSIEYGILDNENFEEKKSLKLSVKIIGIEQVNINSKDEKVALWRKILKQKISGKTVEEAISILSNTPEIENIQSISLRPFWTEKIPKKIENIHFKSEEIE